ncbi:MAG: oxidoreductase [Acidimicrobiaceae bacterium]|nr:oxidoreductase [Acidimicrobiaceae bacterium]
MAEQLRGKTAVITGASRGIGAAVAQRFAAEGADIAITARTLDNHPTLPGSLNETAELCRLYGGHVEVIQADLANETSRTTIISTAIEALGSVNILINNAAAAIYKSLDNYTLKHRRLMTEINVQAPLDLTQQALPGMINNGQGWVVNLSSASKKHPTGPPYDLGGVRGVYGFYGATKAMLDRTTSALASELHGTGIRINTVEPKAAVLSEGADVVVGKILKPEQIESMEAMVESILYLATCGPDHTGKNEVSLDVITQNKLTVMSLNGEEPHPGGIRP